MKEIKLSKVKVRNFLAERLTQQVLQLSEDQLFSLIRYEGIGGYEKMSEGVMFVQLVEALPEFKLLKLVDATETSIIVMLKEEYSKTEEEILVDIYRIIQMKLS